VAQYNCDIVWKRRRWRGASRTLCNTLGVHPGVACPICAVLQRFTPMMNACCAAMPHSSTHLRGAAQPLERRVRMRCFLGQPLETLSSPHFHRSRRRGFSGIGLKRVTFPTDCRCLLIVGASVVEFGVVAAALLAGSTSCNGSESLGPAAPGGSRGRGPCGHAVGRSVGDTNGVRFPNAHTDSVDDSEWHGLKCEHGYSEGIVRAARTRARHSSRATLRT